MMMMTTTSVSTLHMLLKLLVFHVRGRLDLAGIEPDGQVLGRPVQPNAGVFGAAVALFHVTLLHIAGGHAVGIGQVGLVLFQLFVGRTVLLVVHVVHGAAVRRLPIGIRQGLAAGTNITDDDTLVIKDLTIGSVGQGCRIRSLKLLLGLNQKPFNLLRRHFFRQLTNDFHAAFANEPLEILLQNLPVIDIVAIGIGTIAVVLGR